MKYFRDDNTEGYSTAELAALNEQVEILLAEMGDGGLDDPLHADNVKNACDIVSNRSA